MRAWISRFGIACLCVFFHNTYALNAPFSVLASGSSITLNTNTPGHSYTKAGIQIPARSGAFTLNNFVSPLWYLFNQPISDTIAYPMTITGPKGTLEFSLALNAKGPLSVQDVAIQERFLYSTSSASGGEIYICNINTLIGNVSGNTTTTGALTNCGITSTAVTYPTQMVFNQTGSLLFAADYAAPDVSVCQVDMTSGAISNCATYDSGGSASGVAINAANTILYVVNYDGSAVTCSVTQNTGALSNCQNVTLPQQTPRTIVLNPAGTFAYITNYSSSSVTICSINPVTQLLENCALSPTAQTPGGSDVQQGIAMSPSGKYLYVTTYYGNTYRCIINQFDGSLSDCLLTVEATSGGFYGAGIQFINNGTLAYTANTPNFVNLCTVDANTGMLSNCAPANTTSLPGLALLAR